MAYLWSEDFSNFSAWADMSALGWGFATNAPSIGSGAGYNGTNSIRPFSSSSGPYHATSPVLFTVSGNEVRGAFWLKTTAGLNPGSATSLSLFMLADASLTNGFGVSLTTGGILCASKYALFSSNVMGTASAYVASDSAINDGQQHHVEFRLVPDASAGVVQVWRDGVMVINQTGVNTINAGATGDATGLCRLRVANLAFATMTQDISHVLLWDASGSSLNGHLGQHQLSAIIPNGAGDLSGLTPLSGANYTNVDEVVMDGDTSYVEASASGTKDLYAYSDLSSTDAAIAGVIVRSIAKSPDLGGKTFRALCKSGTTTQNGSDKTLTTAYARYDEFLPTDPSTGLAWGDSGVNAAQFGVEVRT